MSSIFTIIQFERVDTDIDNITHSVIKSSVHASYDIMDTTVNESIKTYLKGVAATVQRMTNAGRESGLSPVQIDRLLDQYTNSTKIGEHGYVSITSAKGRLLYHPHRKGEDVSQYDFVKNN